LRLAHQLVQLVIGREAAPLANLTERWSMLA
jgi:hypothetical protein